MRRRGGEAASSWRRPGQPDASDKDALYAPNLIRERSTSPAPLKVLDSRVEDNPNNAPDHLQIRLTNKGKSGLKDFDL